ncbi:MAG TPA: hypothetical protein VKT76_12105, partial [Bradyrhizobium sp.]|nr:hypothetical protein [Bradyrhizobium sp.]
MPREVLDRVVALLLAMTVIRARVPRTQRMMGPGSASHHFVMRRARDTRAVIASESEAIQCREEILDRVVVSLLAM